LTCSGHTRAGGDGVAVVEQHRADGVGIERKRKAEPATFKAQQFVQPNLRQAGNRRDAV